MVNSSGIARFKEYHFEMVRLGIGLYGVDGSPIQAQLKVVNTLKTAVSQVKVVPVGDSVGYNRNSGVLLEEKQIATIRIGYADGFLRLAGGGRYQVRIGNRMVPTIGNICMDMTMIDITGLQEVRPGDEVVVFGDRPTVQDLASCLQTIPYEVFTNISDRVKRVYIQE
jgi:alanine racemase